MAIKITVLLMQNTLGWKYLKIFSMGRKKMCSSKAACCYFLTIKLLNVMSIYCFSFIKKWKWVFIFCNALWANRWLYSVAVREVPVTHKYFPKRYSGFTLSPNCTQPHLLQNKARKGILGGGVSFGGYKLFAGGCAPKFRTSDRRSESQILHLLIDSQIWFLYCRVN